MAKKKKVLTEDGFTNFASRVGLNTNNSLSKSDYTFNLVTRNRILLEAAYRGSWTVGKFVDAPADDMTRSGVILNTREGEEDLEDFKSAQSALSLWPSLCSMIRWGRLYGGSIAVFQIEGQNLSTPLDVDTISQDSFKGLAVYDRWQLYPIVNEPIEDGPNIGLPKYYDIVSSASLEMPGPETSIGRERVHHTRVIRNIGIELPFFQAITEQMWGESILERVYDRLIAFDNATLSAANLIERANNRTVSVESLREIIAAGGKSLEGLKAQFDMMREFQTNEGLTLLDKNDNFQTTSYSFAGLSDILLQFGQQLGGGFDMPLVRFFGQSPAGLSATGESDMRMYYDSINAQQNAKLRSGVDTMLRVLWRSTFGQPEPEDFTFQFTPLWQMSAMDKANIAKTQTETILGAQEGGLISKGTALKELRNISGDTGVFSNITDEEINEAETEEPPIPGMMGQGEQVGELKAKPNPTEPDAPIPKKPVPSLDRGVRSWMKSIMRKKS